ncbi:MYND-type zinc finger protein MUB1 [Venturia nashicola]|uniref:MYND-type zinc finger protein samB n=1 Tax=Venturia nashicola TaxID=86259 RepID=A0A4Z1P449_9PEZI|nr:MYND-type zinc finger protein MUB1 [Venturia nashicola]TLD29531.1 MYND-type zinc finger protein MUB1 [Venturia nashicola]
MREVNFSIPNANKASVGITTALYDRRALDCTSTLPLINSLNNLAYLTTSSARIRDILTVDGGVERLVCILKEGRLSKEMMDCWKWNLAFQCVVNIGVRGSETVRTRVVEADMVPVIATILDNYIKVIDKCREKADAEYKRNKSASRPSHTFYQRADQLLAGHANGLDRIRRQAPPPIDIPATTGDPVEQTAMGSFSLSSPPERTTFARTHHHNRSNAETRAALFAPHVNSTRSFVSQPPVTSVPTMDNVNVHDFSLRPVRDADRLPSMLPSISAAELSRPESPTTPSAPGNPHIDLLRRRPERRPSIRHQLSMSQDSDEAADEADAEASNSGNVSNDEAVVGIESEINMQDVVDQDAIIESGGSPVQLDPPNSETAEVDAFSLARAAIESSMVTPTNNQTALNLNISPIQNITPTQPLPITVNPYARYVNDRSVSSMPRDEDVLMCLQLLAYVSKYCNLRSYFQRSHLVPKLKISSSELAMFDGDNSTCNAASDEELIEEYLQPDDFNIFPLVEKFTVHHHSQDMQYWAGVVMRNLCRKDDARGGIRQCAYYQCGKWEEFTRQFAKCRRCRRTKYCSKECQKNAWIYHRHWCVAAAA